MDSENFEEFEDYKNRVLQSKIKYSEKSNDEIIEEMEQIVKAYETQKRGG